MATLARLELELVTSLAKFQQDMGRAAAVAERTAKRIEGVMKGVGGSLAAIGAGMAFKSIIDEAGEAEQALKQLQQTIKSTGGVAGVTSGAVEQISGEIQRLTGVSDDAVNSMASVLLTFTKVGKQVFPEATKAIVDMSAKLGTDLKSSAVMVGKALNDPIKGMTALSKAGVSFSQGQKDTIKALVESGNTLKAQQMILRELQTEFGGAAAAARNTLKGAFDALGVAAKDVLENIGSAQGQGLRGALEFMIQVTEKAAAHGKELSLALQGIAAGATAVVAVKTASELAGLAKMIVTVTAAGGGWVAGLALIVGGLVAFRDEQATLIGSTKTWGQLTVEAFNGIAMIAKPVINGVIDSFIEFGKWCGAVSKMVVDTLGGAFRVVFQALGQQDLFDKVTKGAAMFMSTLPGAMKAFADTANKQSAAAGKDYVGNFFNPILKLADDAKKRMDDIGKAAERGAKVKINPGELPEVEGKSEKKAREKAEKAAEAAAKRAKAQHEADQKSVEGILGSMQQMNAEISLRLAKEKEMIPELEAQNKLSKLGHLTEKERAAALTQINKLAAERRELEKQVAVKDEGEKLTSLLDNLKQRTTEIQNAGNKQNELNVSLKTQAEIDKIIKVGKGEHLDLVNKILAAAKEQEAVLREQKRLEAVEKYGSQVQDLMDQNKQMALKVQGQEEYLPLLEQEKKIREIMKDQNLSEEDKQNLAGQIQQQAQQTVRYNQALDQQDRALKAIKDSSGSTAQKIAALQMAYASGTINIKQYQDSLQDLRKEGLEKVKKDAKEFSDILTNGFDKMFEKGTKIKDVLKGMGVELMKMATKKIIAPLAENVFSGIANKLFGKQYGSTVPNGLPPSATGGGGTLAGGAAGMGTLPTTLAEGPAIVSLLQQILVALGGTPGVGPGSTLGGLGFPYGPPSTVQQYQNGGGLLSRVGGFFGNLFNFGQKSPLEEMLGAASASGLQGGMPSSGGGGGIFGALGGVGRTVSNGALGLLRALGFPFHADGGFLGAGQWGIAGERGPELIYGGQSGMSIMPPAMMTGASGFQAPWQQQNVYAGGRGGYSGNGMISQFDYANTMGDLMMAKYESGVKAFQNGDPNAPNWYTLQEIKAQADRFRTTVANGGYTGQMFSRAQFEMSSASADFNEAAYQWGGNRANVSDYLYNQGVRSGYDPSKRMNSMSFGLQSGGMGQMSQGGNVGFDLPSGMREASFSTSQGIPIISTGAGGLITSYTSNGAGGITGKLVNGMSTAFNNMFNGGNFMTASQQGSYSSPLLPRRGSDWLEAVGRQNLAYNGGGAIFPELVPRLKEMTSGANGGKQIYPSTFSWLPGYAPRGGGIGNLFADWRLRGMDVDPNSAGGFSNPNTRFGTGETYGPPVPPKLMPDMINGVFPGPATASEIAAGQRYLKRTTPQLAPDMISGMLTGSGPATVSDIMAGQRYMDEHWPGGYKYGGATAQGAYPLMADILDHMPSGLEAALRTAYEGHTMLNDAMPWFTSKTGIAKHFAGMAMNGITNKNSLYSQMGEIMSQPWANKSMPFSSYPAAMSLFGGRAMRHGGMPHRGEPIRVGEAGEELWVPPTGGGRIIPNHDLGGFGGGSGGGKLDINVVTRTEKPVRVRTVRTERGIQQIVEDAVDASMQRQGTLSRQFQGSYDVNRRGVARS